MIVLNQTYELLAGGHFLGNQTWNKAHTEIDNCFKIYQLVEGSVHICNENEDILLEKNKLYFINGNTLSRQYCTQSFSLDWLHFIPKDLFIYQALASAPTVVELPWPYLTMENTESYMHQLLGSEDNSSWQIAVSRLMVQTLIQNIVTSLIETHSIGEASISADIYRIEPAIHYIYANYKESVPLEKLAELCCMSPNYFHRIFKQLLHITPANYVILLRMNASLSLLKSRTLTIKQIASDLGFTDDAHFSKVFKKYYGITPGDYQKNKQIII